MPPTLTQARASNGSSSPVTGSIQNDDLSQNWVQTLNADLDRIVHAASDVEALQELAFKSLSQLAAARDPETGNHLLRTKWYVRSLAKILQNDRRYADELSEARIDLLERSAPLHDIGKVAIPDSILLKPGKLTDSEWRIMKTHVTIGRRIVEVAEKVCASNCQIFDVAKEIVYAHHEKWDGSGYPEGLSGAHIPLSARIMAISDVFDALISARVYKPAFRFEETVHLIVEGRGRHFDPHIVEAFVAHADDFAAIARVFPD